MPSTISRRLLGRVAGATVAAGLALGGLIVAAAPASAAACTGTSGVTVVVDRGNGSISTRCASGDPSSALKALTAAGFAVTYPQQYPGSVVCRIDGYPASDPCVQMPPGDAYWAFFHAKRGGSWAYSSTGVGSYDPAPGTVVGFRFGSGQQPSIAPPAPTRTSEPAPTKTTSEPDRTTAAPRSTTTRTTSSGSTAPRTTASTTAAGGTASPKPGMSRSASPSVSPTGSPSTSASPSPSSSAGGTTGTETLAAAATSAEADGSSGPGTLLAGGALLALVAGGAGWAAWKRRS